MTLLPAEQGIREVVWTVWNFASPETLDEVTKTLRLFEFWNIEGTQLAVEPTPLTW